MSFNENTADVGPVAYIDKLNLCSWSSYQSPYFRIDSVLKWQFVELRCVCSVLNILYCHVPCIGRIPIEVVALAILTRIIMFRLLLLVLTQTCRCVV